MVFIGSPGTGVNNVSSLHLDPGAQVFAAAARGDYVTWTPGASALPGNFLGAGAGMHFGLPGAVFGWIKGGEMTRNPHGIAPTNSDYGATTFGTDGSFMHSEYYEAESQSLANIARIAVGGQPRR